MGVVRVDDVGRYGTVRIDDGRVTGFEEKAGDGPGCINSGVYIVAPDIFEGCDLPPAFSFERDFLQPRIGRLAPLAFEARGRFIDIGVPEDYRRAQELFAGEAAAP
jgi:D-glycero-alpha-D-manno-heptose 1-phosphate guanylyltransferase